MTHGLSGWVILDKPAGMTSTKAGSIIKRLCRTKKLGHIGTLDPFATGVLPLALGEATKLIPYVDSDQKTYQFEVTWGVQTSTGDPEGEVLEVSEKRPSFKQIADALPLFMGEITQVPPMYSAIKINGVRAYELARRGDAAEMPSRRVTIHALRLVNIVSADRACFEVTCSAGTYVRTLGQDLACMLGTVGHVSQLRRTQAGKFVESMSISLAELEKKSYTDVLSVCLPLGAVLDDIPAVSVLDADHTRFCRGQSIQAAGLPDGFVTVWAQDTLVGMGRIESDLIHPVRLIHNI